MGESRPRLSAQRIWSKLSCAESDFPAHCRILGFATEFSKSVKKLTIT